MHIISGVKKDYTGDMIRVQILEKVLLGGGEERGEGGEEGGEGGEEGREGGGEGEEEGGEGGRERGGEGEGTVARGIETGRVLNSSPGDSVIVRLFLSLFLILLSLSLHNSYFC